MGAWGEFSAGNESVIVLSGKGYVGPSGSCLFDYVSETARPKGALLSAVPYAWRAVEEDRR
jgi:hypothetical protein